MSKNSPVPVVPNNGESETANTPQYKVFLGKCVAIFSPIIAATTIASSSGASPQIIYINQEENQTSVQTIVSPYNPEEHVIPVVPSAQDLLIDYFFLKPEGLEPNLVLSQKILNIPETSDAEFEDTLKTWPNDLSIYPYLYSRNAKIRFFKFILRNDDTDLQEYVTPDYGEDVDGDGKITITDKDGMLFDESGKQIVEVKDFVCGDFANMLTARYGISRNINPEDYSKDEIPKKYHLPLFIGSTNEGFSLDEEKAGRGHGINAIYIGDNPFDYEDIRNWYFIEPQNDLTVDDPLSYSIPPVSVTIELFDGAPFTENQSGKTVITFLRTADKSESFILDDVEYQILHKIQSWILMNQSLNNFPDDLMYDEQDFTAFEPGDIQDVIDITLRSGYFPPDLLKKALLDSALPQGFVPTITYPVVNVSDTSSQ